MKVLFGQKYCRTRNSQNSVKWINMIDEGMPENGYKQPLLANAGMYWLPVSLSYIGQESK